MINPQGPFLLVDEQRWKRNIQRMAQKARAAQLLFRPHFKTHQSRAIGQWFKEAGVQRITVSSVSLAQYFASAWKDISIAFPLNIHEIPAINELAHQINVQVLVEDLTQVRALIQGITHPVGVFLNLDVGYHRSGLAPHDYQKMDALISEIASADFLAFKGWLGHAGHSYRCRSKEEILSVHQQSQEIVTQLKQTYASRYPQALISLGDTPTCSVAQNFEGVDEIRPGNFVFYDLTQQAIGSNTFDEIAVAMSCPVVAIHPKRNEAVVYGGGAHFSKDRLSRPDGEITWGQVMAEAGHTWGQPINGFYLKSLSQEHGILSVPPEQIATLSIGQRLLIAPVHSCMAALCMGGYLTTDGKQLDHAIQ
ncbi:MAG: alanine racemase, partial [Bacteroidota bacterium]